MINGSFVKNDLQLKASYGSSPSFTWGANFELNVQVISRKRATNCRALLRKLSFEKRSCGCAMSHRAATTAFLKTQFPQKSPTICGSFAKETHHFKEPTKTSRSHNYVSQNSKKSAMKLFHTIHFVAIWLWRIYTKWNCAAAPHFSKVCSRNILRGKLCRELTFENFYQLTMRRHNA